MWLNSREKTLQVRDQLSHENNHFLIPKITPFPPLSPSSSKLCTLKIRADRAH